MQDKKSGIFNNLAHDIPSALVVFLVALPLCLGIALASGAPLFSGLIAGIVGGIVVGALSQSPLSVSGPAAGLATIVFSAIQELQSFQLFLVALVLAGGIQVILGFVRAGSIGHFFPVSVIKGMLAAIGIILILKQIPHALGYDADYEGDESFFQPDHQNTFTEIVRALEFLSPGAIVISAVSLIILIGWTQPFIRKYRWSSYVPAPLVVVVVGITLNFLFNELIPSFSLEPTHLVNLGGWNGRPDTAGDVFLFPDWSGLLRPEIYQIAITIAIVASLESLLSIEATDKLDPHRRITPLNRELKAQGVSNIVSGLLGGLPVTAVIVRSSANILGGARTKLSAILHGVILFVVVAAAPGILQLVPLASLAGVLLVVGYKLNTPDMYRETLRKGLDQFLPFVVTILAILLSDLLIGIAIGFLVSVFFVLRTNVQTAVIIVSDSAGWLIKLTKDVSFIHKAQLRRAFESVPPGASVVLDGSRSQFLDADILETIEDFIRSAPSRAIVVEVRKTPGATTHLFRLDPEPVAPRNGVKQHARKTQ